MVSPVVAVAEGDADQGLAVPLRAGDQGAAGLAGVSRLHPGAPLVLPQEFVVVDQLPVLQGEAFGDHCLRHRGVLQAGPAQLGHVQGGSIMVLIPQTVGVGEVGVGHPQILGPLVHPAYEGVHIPGAGTGQGHRRVVPRGEEQAVEEGFQGQGLPRHQVEGGPLDPRPFPLDLHLAGEVSPQVLRRHQGGHEFRGAGDGPGGVLVLGVEHPAGLPVHQNSGGRGNRRRLRRLGMEHQPWQQGAEHPQGRKLFSHPNPLLRTEFPP